MDATPLRSWAYLALAQIFDGEPPPPDPPPPGPPAVRDAADALVAELAAPDSDWQSEFVRLFVNAPGGVPAPPYASYYLDGDLQGPSTAWTLDAYRAQGLDAAPGAGEPPDYLAAELEFMYFLARHEMAAQLTANAGALAAVRHDEGLFVHEHLARWVPSFAERVRRASPSPLYAAATDLLRAVVDDDSRRLSIRGCNLTASRPGR